MEGVTALFSWPSKGDVIDYPSDEATIQASEPFLEEFLRELASKSGAEEVHILAHSMGNRGLLRVMERLSNDQSFNHVGIFGQIFLAAPDVDNDVFSQLARAYPQMSKRTTLYISSKDRALKSSGIIHDYPRVGFFPPITVIPGIDTINVSEIDLTILGHSYFAEASTVLTDMHQLLHFDADPWERARLHETFTSKNERLWEIMK